MYCFGMGQTFSRRSRVLLFLHGGAHCVLAGKLRNVVQSACKRRWTDIDCHVFFIQDPCLQMTISEKISFDIATDLHGAVRIHRYDNVHVKSEVRRCLRVSTIVHDSFIVSQVDPSLLLVSELINWWVRLDCGARDHAVIVTVSVGANFWFLFSPPIFQVYDAFDVVRWGTAIPSENLHIVHPDVRETTHEYVRSDFQPSEERGSGDPSQIPAGANARKVAAGASTRERPADAGEIASVGRASSDASETLVGVSVREATTDADAGEIAADADAGEIATDADAGGIATDTNAGGIATDADAGGIAKDTNAGGIAADVRSEENERMLNLLSKSPDDVSLRNLHQVKNLIRR